MDMAKIPTSILNLDGWCLIGQQGTKDEGTRVYRPENVTVTQSNFRHLKFFVVENVLKDWCWAGYDSLSPDDGDAFWIVKRSLLGIRAVLQKDLYGEIYGDEVALYSDGNAVEDLTTHPDIVQKRSEGGLCYIPLEYARGFIPTVS